MKSKEQRQAQMENMKKTIAFHKSRGFWECKNCKKKILNPILHQLRKTYCSNSCMSNDYKVRLAGENNPHYLNSGNKTCEQCNKEFKHYLKSRRFCSMACRDKHGLSLGMRNNARKDSNHNEMVEYLQKGNAVVKDCSKMMHGMPDLLVWHMEAWHLVEIKNPNTSYGKKGLSPSQLKFANEWQGGPVYIVRTKEDCELFLIGELKKLDHFGGYHLTTNCDEAK